MSIVIEHLRKVIDTLDAHSTYLDALMREFHLDSGDRGLHFEPGLKETDCVVKALYAFKLSFRRTLCYVKAPVLQNRMLGWIDGFLKNSLIYGSQTHITLWLFCTLFCTRVRLNR